MVKDHIGKISVRKEDAHKGDYGRVFIIAGSKGMTGAAYLCSMGAMRSGSGLVTCAVPETLSDVMEIKMTEVMTLSLPSDTKGTGFGFKCLEKVLKFAEKCESAAIGPGLGISTGVRKLVPELVRSIECPIVLDADGLNIMADNMSLMKERKNALVLTPHPGEAARMLETTSGKIQEDRKGWAIKLSQKTGAVVCLKGHKTVVADPGGEVFINDTGNSGMATAGMGDILTGIIASFIGQGLEPFSAAVSGVYLHGMAGDISVQKKGAFSTIASDLLDNLHEAFNRSGI